MEFKEFRDLLRSHFKEMTDGGRPLFVVHDEPGELWNTYIESFPKGTNETFRSNREFDCHECRRFICLMGNVVVINDDYTLSSLWDFEVPEDTPKFGPVVGALSRFVHCNEVVGPFLSVEPGIGREKTFHMIADGHVEAWDHFHVSLPAWVRRDSQKIVNKERGTISTSRHTLQRAVEEITGEAICAVLELIESNSLYRDAQWKMFVQELRDIQTQYADCPDEFQNNFLWFHSGHNSARISHIRDSSIGTLLVDLSAGMAVDEAVRRFEAVMA
jgi:hypothetical protein